MQVVCGYLSNCSVQAVIFFIVIQIYIHMSKGKIVVLNKVQVNVKYRN